MYGREERITETTYTNHNGAPGPSGPPPQVPPPWRAQWDPQSQRWYFVNDQTRETRWEFPQNNFYAGPPSRPYGETENVTTTTIVQEDRGAGKQHHGSGLGWGMAGAAAGLVGGALLMHEGHEISV